MEKSQKKARVISSGAVIMVYRINSKAETWCNANDCKTEYKQKELEFLGCDKGTKCICTTKVEC